VNGDASGDGGGKELDRVAGVLRGRMNEGAYPRGSLLPTQRELAEEFGVSRDTVQRVLRELRSEGWIESRQGSGTRVVKGQRVQSPTSSGMVTLRPLIDHAFTRPEVTLDVFTLTSESLDAHVLIQAERIRAGLIAPQSITLRMLLPSESLAVPYWWTGDAAEDERLKARFRDITRRHTVALRAALKGLHSAGFVPSVDLQIRRGLLMPHAKLYLLNGTEAVLGPYRVYKRSIEMDDGEVIDEVRDVEGLGAGLTHFVKDAEPDSQGTVFVTGMQEWFDSVWEHLTE
jgi:hypothetical protein